MRSIIDIPINLSVDYVKRHRHQLAHFFNHLEVALNKQKVSPLLAYKIKSENFDITGTLWLNRSTLDSKSLQIIQTIEDSYLSTSFFLKKANLIGSRGYVYYCSALSDQDTMRSFLRLVNYTITSAQLLQDIYPKNNNRWELGIYALLDDIRYKLLLLENSYPLVFLNHKNILQKAIRIFYDYLQGTMPPVHEIKDFTERLRVALFLLLQTEEPLGLRTYKEADNPLDNITFRETLAQSAQDLSIDAIVGMRFGGVEMPYILSKYFPHAKINLVRISTYAEGKNTIKFSNSLKDKSVLVVDDNILTGRTLAEVVGILRSKGSKKIYFGCISYSGMRRYHQMLMEDHGVINPEVLLNSCVIAESPYTKITNTSSYKNKSGNFDKVKATLQKRLSFSSTRYSL